MVQNFQSLTDAKNLAEREDIQVVEMLQEVRVKSLLLLFLLKDWVEYWYKEAEAEEWTSRMFKKGQCY